MFRMFAGSSLKYENQLSTATSAPDPARADELPHRDPGRVEAVHERLHQVDAGGLAGGDHPLGVGRGHRQRLLAQDVLAGTGRGDRPLGVEVVGQRDVDGVDLGVGQERLVRAVSTAGSPARRRPSAASPSRDAIATISQRAALRSPGMTLCRAISAVDRIPQRSVLMADRPSRLLDTTPTVDSLSHTFGREEHKYRRDAAGRARTAE